MANLLAAPDDLPIGAKVRLTSNNQKVIESTVVAPAGGPGAGVDSFEGRTGVVVSASGDYNSSEVDNLSVNPGATVTAALDFLRLLIQGLTTGVSSFNLRQGAVVSAAADYSTTLITNSSAVLGATATDALNNLQATIAGLVTGVSSFAGRGGAVVPAAGDYNSTLVTNSSTVAGATVSDALNTLASASPGGATWSANWGAVAAPATAALRFFLRTNGIVGGSNDLASFFVCGVSGTLPVTLTFTCGTALAIDSLVVQVRRNGADVASLVVNIAPGATTGTVTATITVAKGDRFSVKLTQSASEAQAAWNGTASIVVGA